jgi:hypothetical protein
MRHRCKESVDIKPFNQKCSSSQMTMGYFHCFDIPNKDVVLPHCFLHHLAYRLAAFVFPNKN